MQLTIVGESAKIVKSLQVRFTSHSYTTRYNVSLFAVHIVVYIKSGFFVRFKIKGLLGDGNNKALKLVLAIVADVCSVAYLITAILLRDFGVNIGLETRGVAAPICAAVIAQLLLAVVIVGNALYKSEKK